MNRREFVKTVGLITAGAVIAPALSFSAKTYPLRHIGIPLPEELREAHEFMLEQGYYWHNLFGRNNLPDDADYTQSEYLRTFLDTNTKIAIRQYHEGEHWMVQDPAGKWTVIHRSWIKDILYRLVYAQERGLTYKGNTYDGRKYKYTFRCKDGSFFNIFEQEPRT
jgi:hypothetical protein